MTRRYRPKGFWDDLSNIDNELQKLIDKLGHFPSYKELQENDTTLSFKMSKYGGINKFREKFGYKINRRGSWTLDETLEEARKLIDEHGHLPTTKELRELNFSTFSYAVKKHGGHDKICTLLGIKSRRKGKGLWQDLEYTLEQARKFMEDHPEYDFLPSKNELLKYNGGASLVMAFDKYHGGIQKIRLLLNQKNPQTKVGNRKNLKLLLEEAKLVIDQNGFDRVPSSTTFRKLGYEHIVRSAVKYHGGFSVFREKLREYIGQESEDSQLEVILEDYLGGSKNV